MIPIKLAHYQHSYIFNNYMVHIIIKLQQNAREPLEIYCQQLIPNQVFDQKLLNNKIQKKKKEQIKIKRKRKEKKKLFNNIEMEREKAHSRIYLYFLKS